MKLFITLVLVVTSLSTTKAAIKEPGWKHCIHPLHALPNQWGKIVSPGFPNGINTQIQCSWVISSNPGYRIKLAFHTLNVTGSRKSCYTQFVEIMDYKVGHSMGKFCGSSRPGDYVSWGTRVRFDLQGDTSGAKTKGFDLRFKATKEPGGFKPTWTFPVKPKASKPKRKPPPKNRPRAPPSGSRRPAGPPRASGGSRPKPKPKPAPAKPPAEKTSVIPKAANAPKRPAPLPSADAPAPLIRPTQPNNRIEFRAPPPQRNGPVIYGANSNARGVDHGHSNVVPITQDEENIPDMYLIVGIAAGGVVILVILIVIMKVCIYDKNKKRKAQRKELQQQQRASPNQNVETGEDFTMGVMPRVVPEQYMSEQIVPRHQSFHRMQSLPAGPPQTMSRHYPVMYPTSLRGTKSRTSPPMMIPSSGVNASRSRARSSRSRSSKRAPMSRTKSRSSMRGRRSKSLPRKRSRSLQYLPSQIDGWVRVDQRPLPAHASKRRYPLESDLDSSDLTSSSDWDSDSSRERRPKRHSSVPRMKSQPATYDPTMPRPYYVIDSKSRDFDEGYDTGRRTNGTKSSASRRRNKKKSGKKQKGRKYSY